MIVNPATSDVPWSRASLARFQESMELADPALTAPALEISIVMNPAHAGKWLDGSGHTVDELLAFATAGKPLPHFTLVPSLRAKTKIERREPTSQNTARWTMPRVPRRFSTWRRPCMIRNSRPRVGSFSWPSLGRRKACSGRAILRRSVGRRLAGCSRQGLERGVNQIPRELAFFSWLASW